MEDNLPSCSVELDASEWITPSESIGNSTRKVPILAYIMNDIFLNLAATSQRSHGTSKSGACLGQKARQLKNGEEWVVGLGGLEVRKLSLSGPGRAEDDFIDSSDSSVYQKRWCLTIR